MDNVTYRKNVFKTLSIKPAKEGVKYAARNTARINLFHATTGLATECMELVKGLTPYILEGKVSAEAKDNAFEELGDVGYYLNVLAKTLKLKAPSSTKKVKLVGTRAKALLDLLGHAETLLSIQKKVFYGLKTKDIVKNVAASPAKGLKPAQEAHAKTMQVLDAEAQDAVDVARAAAMLEPLNAAIGVFYALCFDMFNVAPAAVYAGNIAKLAHRYPEGFFEVAKANAVKDTGTEVKKAKAAAAVVDSAAKAETKPKAAKPKAPSKPKAPKAPQGATA